MSWTYCIHTHCFRTWYRCKIWASLRKLFAHPGVQSTLRVCWWLLPCKFCQLCHSAQSFHNQIFHVWHQIWTGEINVKSIILELYIHNDTKIYMSLTEIKTNNGELANIGEQTVNGRTTMNWQIVPRFTWNNTKRMSSKSRCYVGS